MSKRPARLDIVDMPRDEQRSLGTLRQALCASFNYCRKYPAKMETLKTVIKYVHTRIVAWEKEQEAYSESLNNDLTESLKESPKAPVTAPKTDPAKSPTSEKKAAPAAK